MYQIVMVNPKQDARIGIYKPSIFCDIESREGDEKVLVFMGNLDKSARFHVFLHDGLMQLHQRLFISKDGLNIFRIIKRRVERDILPWSTSANSPGGHCDNSLAAMSILSLREGSPIPATVDGSADVRSGPIGI